MNFLFTILSSTLLLFCSLTASAAEWQAPKSQSIVRLCGSVLKAQTPYDGVQTVFTQKDQTGATVGTYFLEAIGKSTEGVLMGIALNQPQNDICVIGFEQDLGDRIMTDSPNSFLTLQLVF